LSLEIADQDEPLSESFGRFRILNRLGKGGMGSVYLASDTLMNREVALKIPRFGRKNREVMLERFRREARAAAGFDHPNLCRVDKFDQVDGTPYLTMPYLEGRTLADCLEPREKLSQRSVAALVRTLALAMSDAHAKGVVHRDLKPSNVMIVKGRGPVIVDFGLSLRVGYHDDGSAGPGQAAGDDARVTIAGSVMGTVGYMAPEQVAGDLSVIGEGSDIYSLGVILYELLAGRLPFEGPSAVVMGLIMAREPEPPSAHRPDLHPRLDAICRKAMAKRVGDRFPSMLEFVGALGRYLRNEELTNLLDPAATSDQLGKPAVQRLIAQFLDEEPGLDAPGPGEWIKPYLSLLPDSIRKHVVATVGGRLGSSLGRLSGLVRSVAGRFKAKHVRIIALMTVLVFVGLFILEVNKLGFREGLERSRRQRSIQSRSLSHDNGVAVRLPASLNYAPPPILWPDAHVLSVVFTPDGKRLLAGGDVAPYLQLYDLRQPNTPVIRRLNGHTSWVNQVALSADGRRALSGSNDRTMRLWDVETGREVRPPVGGFPSAVERVALSRDGTRAAASSENVLVCWDLDRGSPSRYAHRHTGLITSVTFSPDGQRLLTTSVDGTARLWDADSLRERLTFNGHAACVACGDFSPDGRQILTLSGDQTVQLWDADTGRSLRTMRVPPFAKSDDGCNGDWVVFSPDGRVALTTHRAKSALALWELDAGMTVSGHLIGRPLNKAVFSSDGRQVACGSFRGVIERWEIRPPSEVRAGSATEPVGEVRRFGPGGGYWLNRIAFSRDGRQAIASGGAVFWYDLESGREVRKALEDGPRFGRPGLALSSDGGYLLTGHSGDPVVRLLDMTTGWEVRVFRGHTQGINNVTVSPDGSRAVSAGRDGTLRLWDVATGTEVRRFVCDAGDARCVAFQPDGRRILSGHDSRHVICLWDVETGKKERRFEGHSGPVHALAIPPDNRSFLSASEDGTVRLWEIETGREVQRLKHSGAVHAVAVSSDGRRVLSSGWGAARKVIGLWQLSSGHEEWSFVGHQGDVLDIAFSPDNRSALSSDTAGTAILWRLPSYRGRGAP
jgi:WD40 repeat protein/serine/threonine protein kinase